MPNARGTPRCCSAVTGLSIAVARTVAERTINQKCGMRIRRTATTTSVTTVIVVRVLNSIVTASRVAAMRETPARRGSPSISASPSRPRQNATHGTRGAPDSLALCASCGWRFFPDDLAGFSPRTGPTDAIDRDSHQGARRRVIHWGKLGLRSDVSACLLLQKLRGSAFFNRRPAMHDEVLGDTHRVL